MSDELTELEGQEAKRGHISELEHKLHYHQAPSRGHRPSEEAGERVGVPIRPWAGVFLGGASARDSQGLSKRDATSLIV